MIHREKLNKNKKIICKCFNFCNFLCFHLLQNTLNLIGVIKTSFSQHMKVNQTSLIWFNCTTFGMRNKVLYLIIQIHIKRISVWSIQFFLWSVDKWTSCLIENLAKVFYFWKDTTFFSKDSNCGRVCVLVMIFSTV